MSIDELEDEIDEINDCLRECDYEPWELIKKTGNKDDLIRRLWHANGRIEEGSANEDMCEEYWHGDDSEDGTCNDSDTDTESGSDQDGEDGEEDRSEDEDSEEDTEDAEEDCLDNSSAQQHMNPHDEVKRLTAQIGQVEGELREKHSNGIVCKSTRKDLRSPTHNTT